MREFMYHAPDVAMLVFLSACAAQAGAIVLVFIYRWRMSKTFETLNNMLDDVARGCFCETSFDESKLSAFESRFAHFLLASKLSVLNMEEDRNKIKELITDISHQTKTPISNMLLYSELMMENCENEESYNDLDALHKQAQKLCFLIDSLVKLSRLETGIITVSPDRSSVIGLVNDIYEQYQVAANQKGLALVLDICSQDSSLYMAKYDKKWTAEAVGNIVDNAIKYTQSGSITIAVKPYELFCCIEIADTGTGIAEQELPKIFKRFYRSQSVNQVQGIGIGLYLAREIISAEGGYIKAVSRLGKGTMFGIYLPK